MKTCYVFIEVQVGDCELFLECLPASIPQCCCQQTEFISALSDNELQGEEPLVIFANLLPRSVIQKQAIEELS